MPNAQVLSLSGSLFQATALKTALANSKLRLFKSSFVPNENSPLADFVSAEADYTGYPAGGNTLAAWLDPILAPGTGYSTGSPLSQFDTDDPTTVGNTIGGWFLVTSGGVLIGYGTVDTPVPMQTPGQGFPISIRWGFPNG